MPHKAVAESLTPPNRILLTCNRVHNAFVSHGKRRRDFFYYNKKDYRSSFRQNQNHEQDNGILFSLQIPNRGEKNDKNLSRLGLRRSDLQRGFKRLLKGCAIKNAALKCFRIICFRSPLFRRRDARAYRLQTGLRGICLRA